MRRKETASFNMFKGPVEFVDHDFSLIRSENDFYRIIRHYTMVAEERINKYRMMTDNRKMREKFRLREKEVERERQDLETEVGVRENWR